jgi:hypothetical protein
VAALLLELRVRIPPRHGYLSPVRFVCYKVHVSVSDCSLVQRTPTECGVPLCDREASIMRTSLPTRGSCATKKNGK